MSQLLCTIYTNATNIHALAYVITNAHAYTNTTSSDQHSHRYNSIHLPSERFLGIMALIAACATQDSASWDGVLMGSLFSRPHATALFIVDGGAVDIPAEHSYQVDQVRNTVSSDV